MPLFSLIGLIIPLGLEIAGLFAAILAHRGQTSAGTWTLIISSTTCILSTVGLGLSMFFFFTGSSSSGPGPNSNWEIYETIIEFTAILFLLSVFAYCIGIMLMGLKWKSLSKENTDLEQLAQELAAQRDPIDQSGH